MKHILLYIGIFFSSVTALFAQTNDGDPNKKEQKIQALYIAYITQELKLTEDEAQKFWPVHALYDGEIKAANFNQNELERQQLALNTKKKYQDRFIKILGVDRTNNFFKLDAGFRDKMIDRLRKLRQQNQNNKPRGLLRNKSLQDNF